MTLENYSAKYNTNIIDKILTLGFTPGVIVKTDYRRNGMQGRKAKTKQRRNEIRSV